MRIGCTVLILPDAEYSGKFTGMTGKVGNYYGSAKVGVEFPGMKNDCESGLFWFSVEKVKVLQTSPFVEYLMNDVAFTATLAERTSQMHRKRERLPFPRCEKGFEQGGSGSMITLFQHQQQALDQTEGHNRCAYYLDMGLGKTFVGSEKALKLNSRVNLLICQCSKVPDWIDHMVKNYAMNHCWMIYDLTNKKEFEWFMAAVAETDNPTRICGVINYELTFKRKILKTLSGFTLMLDESSLIQNENAKRSKFILGLKPDNVILLSGTPTGGKYEKLWSQCRLLGWNISKGLFWKQYIETEWVEEDGFWRQKITGYKNVDRLKKKLAEHGAVFMTTDDAGISLPKRTMIPVRTPPAKEYWKFWNDRVISINTATLQGFELDSDFWGSNESYERELIGDTSLTRRLYARQLCGLYNPSRYKAFRDLVESTEDRLIVFYNFTEEMERMKGIVKAMNRPISIQSGEVKDLGAYNFHSNSVTFIQYQAGARGGNFQKANKIIYFSLPESWELWEQSQKRIHRMGQERPCFYYWMICPGTVEESIYSTLQMRKDYNDELFRKYEDSHPKG